jgi:hypothetical protein
MAGEYLPPVITRLTMDIQDFADGVAKAKALLKGLQSKVDIDLDVDTAKAMADVAALKAALDALDGRTIAINVVANTQQGSLSALNQTLNNINRAITSMTRRIGSNVAAMAAWGTAATALNASLQPLLNTLNGINGANVAAMAAMTALLNAQANLANANNPAVAQAALLAAQAQLIRAQAAAQRANAPGWLNWMGLGGNLGLWGGAFGSKIPFGAMHAWVLALDAGVEATIALVSASIALGAALAAMQPAAQDIYNRFKAMDQVAVALNGGSGVPPLNGWFEKLQHTVAGNTIGAYGGILDLLQGKANSQTASTIKQISDGIDTWIAKLDLYAKTQNGANGILQHGLGYAGQFSVIVDNLGKSFMNLLQAEPGTVHYLLDFVQGISKGIAYVTHFGTAVKLALGAHALYNYGGLLYNWTSKILGRLPLVGGLITKVMANPAIAIGTAAVALLAYTWNNATRAVGGYIQAQNAALAATSPEGAVNAIPGMIRGDLSGIRGLSVAKIMPDFLRWSNALPGFGDWLKQVGHDFAGAFSPSRGVWGQLGSSAKVFEDIFGGDHGAHEAYLSDLAKYRGEIRNLSGEYLNLFAAGSKLLPQGYSMQQSFGLMALAGVTAKDTYAEMVQKVQMLIKGYGDLGNSAGFLTNSINATSFAVEQQQSHITAVVQGWSQWIGMLTGGADAFSTFEQQMIGINQAMGNAAATVSIANGKVSVSTKGKPGSIDGVTTAQLQNMQAFTTGITDASNLLNQLYTLDSAASLGARGVALLGRAGKDAVAQLFPLAQQLPQLRPLLYGLAQQAGGPAVNSMQALARWLGNVKHPAKDLIGILATFEGAAGNLAQDVKNLALAIDPSMTDAMNNAVVAATGGTKHMEDWATDILVAQGHTKGLTGDAQKLWQQIKQVSLNTGDARNMFDAYNIRLGISRQLSDQLFTDMQKSGGRMTAAVIADLKAIQAYIDSMHGKTINITAQVHMQQIANAISGGSAGTVGPLRGGYAVPPNVTHGAAQPLNVHVHLDGRQIYRSIQTQAVNTQRRTGANGLSKRTR